MSALHTPRTPGPTEHLRHCHGCGCQLSRYNDDTHCGACSRLTREKDPGEQLRVPECVWEFPEIQLALKQRDFGTLCVLVRHLGSLRQEDMATLTGLSQAFLSMLESGARRLTNIDKIVRLLEGLSVPIELTGAVLRDPKTAAELQRLRTTPSGSDAM